MAAGKLHFKSDAGGITSVSREAGATNGELVLPASGTVVSVSGAVTDNAIARYDSTTGKLQNSGAIIDDSNNVVLTYSATNDTSFKQSHVNGLWYGRVIPFSSDGTMLFETQYSGNGGGFRFNVDGVQKAIINSAGNVGIGVTPSASTLPTLQSQYGLFTGTIEVNVAANAYYGGSWKYTENGKASLYYSQGGAYQWYTAPSGTAGNPITWTNAMMLDTNANLTLNSNFISSYAAFTSYGNAQNNYLSMVGRSVVNNDRVFDSTVGGTLKAAILANGTYQSATNVYGSTSDRKLKENIADATPKLDKLMQVQVRNFNYIGQEDKQIGVIAQEIEQIFPSVVFETKDTKQVEVTKERIIPAVEEVKDEEGNVITEAKPESIEEYTETETQETGEVTKNVKYSIIYMMMLKGMQEMRAEYTAEIESLKDELAALKGAK